MIRLATILCVALLAVPAQATKLVPSSKAEVTYSFAPLVRRVAPAVVNVHAARAVERRRSPFAGDPFFERFFGGRDPYGGRPRERMARSLGSGVVVDPSGLVVTNVHVIAGADKVRVAMRDGREYEADIVSQDKASDLAILRLRDVKGAMPSLPIGDSDAIEVGDLVLAVGNPFGVGQTVTSGIVSGLARTRVGKGDFGFFIQTDASINPGNSGGALVGTKGQLVGINTAIFSRSGGSNGIGFAVPSNMVRVLLAAAKRGEKGLTRPYIGAMFESVTYEVSEALGMDRPQGAMVAETVEGGPAARAGLRAGDVVLKLDGRTIEHVDALGYRLMTTGTDRPIAMEVLSRGRTRTVSLTPERAKGAPQVLIQGRSPLSGATIASLTPQSAKRMKLRLRGGIVVQKVKNRSLAARADIRPGDVIFGVNGRPVDGVETLRRLISSRPPFWQIEMLRDGRRLRRVFR